MSTSYQKLSLDRQAININWSKFSWIINYYVFLHKSMSSVLFQCYEFDVIFIFKRDVHEPEFVNILMVIFIDNNFFFW